MKLTALTVDRYGVCENLRLQELGEGLNMIFGRNGSGKSSLARFIRNALYGFSIDDPPHQGTVEISKNGIPSTLFVDVEQVGRGASPYANSNTGGIERSIYDLAYHVDGRDLPQKSNAIADLLRRSFHVPEGRIALGNDTMFNNATQTIGALQARIDELSHRINKLESERNQLVHQIDSEENSYQSRRREKEDGLQQLTYRIEQIDLSQLQHQIETIDGQIADLRLKIDSTQNIQYVSQPFRISDGVSILYRRLDDIDNQIRRWRLVHTDVQEQRVRLKDEMVVWNEMTMDSSSHPYHRSRILIDKIEAKLISTEDCVHSFCSAPERHQARNATQLADDVKEMCSQMRSDLYKLCDELGSQYKSVRHRTAAAELKRLRRCYHEIGENIESLVDHRRVIIEEIRQLDPAGAAAIVRSDNEFCTCAQHQGYLFARRKYVGELEMHQRSHDLVHSDPLVDEKAGLNQLKQKRADLVRELVRLENDLSNLKSQRKTLLGELESIGTIADLSHIRSQLETTQSELTTLIAERQNLTKELDWNKTIRPEPKNAVLESACHWIQSLTHGELQSVWLSNQQHVVDLEIESRSGEAIDFHRLGSGEQQQVVLGICLAIADHCRRLGNPQTIILDDVFVNLDPSLLNATFNSLLQFCERGNQAVALTSDQTVMQLAVDRGIRQYQLPSLDLPQTSVSPETPLSRPERSTTMPFRPDGPVGLAQRHQVEVRSFANYTSPIRTESREALRPTTPIVPRVLEATALPESEPYNHAKIDETSKISELPLDRQTCDALQEIGVAYVSDLLELDPGEVAEHEIWSQAEIDHWQSLAWLLICVPALDFEDADTLIALGINEPEQLESTHAQQLIDRLSRYLNTNDNRRARNPRSYSRATVNRWYDSLGQTRSRWRLPSGYSRRNRWRRSSESRDPRDRSWRERGGLKINRENRSQRGRFALPRTTQAAENRRDNRQTNVANQVDRTPVAPKIVPSESKDAELKFYLNQSDDLEAAPSIGPKTAERFTKIGVNSVGDFLTQTAEMMATKIKYKRISADVIRQWQNQARMVCRIPNLRGHDAQLLVACGITEPEDLAAQSVEKLFAIIQPFSETKEGLKIIRGGKQPDLDEVKDWIDWAKQTRSLQAA